MSFQFAYIPIGVPTFHLESAQKAFDDSVSLLRAIDPDVRVPEEMLLSLDKLNTFLDTLSPDFVIVQNVTFANAAYMSAVLRRFSCPVLLWTLREPVIDGGRLRLNSLTGAYSAANIMRACDQRFSYVFGAEENRTQAADLYAVLTEKTFVSPGRLSAVKKRGMAFGENLPVCAIPLIEMVDYLAAAVAIASIIIASKVSTSMAPEASSS